jgi:STE24 endopeptidase
VTGARARVLAQRPRVLAAALALLAAAAVWAWAAHLLWHSTVPSGLHLGRLDPGGYFPQSFLRRSSSYARFLEIAGVLARAALLVVLVLYARRGHRLMRESAAGRIGTGMLLGMLGFALVWLAEVPFTLAVVWWERRHHVSRQNYAEALLEGFAALGSRFLFISLALAVSMGLAGVLRRWWWALAAPVFVGLALLSTFLSAYLIPNTKPLRAPALRADASALAREEGVPRTRVLVQDVHRYTTAPNAEAVGFGPTRRVILWDTLLDGRFSRSQVRVVIAHELGHIARGHLLRRVGWLALFLIPAAALVALLTLPRGGLARPEAVPVALLVFVVLQLLAAPVLNVVSRHQEAEADWSALNATHDPAGARTLYVALARTSLADPDPPSWAYVLDAGHPTIMQRLAMVRAWQQRRAPGASGAQAERGARPGAPPARTRRRARAAAPRAPAGPRGCQAVAPRLAAARRSGAPRARRSAHRPRCPTA